MKKNHITKQEINELPMGSFEGKINLVQTEEDAVDAAKKLANETLLGFDTETRPAFRRGEKYNPSLLQLAGENDAYLFQLKLTGLPTDLVKILEDENIVKTGVSIKDDLKELKYYSAFNPAGFVDLAHHAKAAGIKNLGLRGLGALLLGFRISKREQVSNWAKKALSPSQIRYAATDAWVGREIYKAMDKGGIIGL